MIRARAAGAGAGAVTTARLFQNNPSRNFYRRRLPPVGALVPQPQPQQQQQQQQRYLFSTLRECRWATAAAASAAAATTDGTSPRWSARPAPLPLQLGTAPALLVSARRQHSGGGRPRREYDDDNDRGLERSSRQKQQRPKQEALRVEVAGTSKGKSTRVCYGCGAYIVPKGKQEQSESGSGGGHKQKGGLSVTAQEKSGYWEEKKALLNESQIKNWSLCPRCKSLKDKASSAGDGVSVGSAAIDKSILPTGAAMEAFRKEVIKIRSHHAVVVLVVDAINVAGTVINTLREYVGGNPILLAVTRCDLLPPYVKTLPKDEARRYFAERAEGLNVAEVFLISLPPDAPRRDEHYVGGEDQSVTRQRRENEGVSQLAAALLAKRRTRDVYVVGAANIGKSTLTDALVDELIAQRGLGAYLKDGRHGARRVEAIREMRVTKSALPGTTLQNIRVPCFVNHTEALWDTPGLLLDVSKHHFPIRNLEAMQRSAPSGPVRPVELRSGSKKFLVQVSEEGDDERMPLLRVVVRLKKSRRDGGDGDYYDDDADADTTRLVWNCVFGLEAKVLDRPPPPPPPLSFSSTRPQDDNAKDEDDGGDPEERQHPLTAEERAARKESRRREHEARVKAEVAEFGAAEVRRRRKEEERRRWEDRRTAKLSKPLHKVASLEVRAGVGTDLAVRDLGWFGFLAPRDALVEVYAPSSGVTVTTAPALALPSEWGWAGSGGGGGGVGDSEDEDDGAEEEFDFDEEDWDEDDYDEWLNDEDGLDFMMQDEWGDRDGGWDGNDIDHGDDDRYHKSETVSGGFPDDPWADYAGPNIGWEFLPDTRWSKGRLLDGWHPIRKPKEEEGKGRKQQQRQKPTARKPPVEKHYHVEYPERWREERGRQQHGNRDRSRGAGRRGANSGRGRGSGRGRNGRRK